MESNIAAPGSVAAVLDGCHYNRGLRAHKVVWEALSRLQWKHFEEFLDNTAHDCPAKFGKLSKALAQLRSVQAPVSDAKKKLADVRSMTDFNLLLKAYD